MKIQLLENNGLEYKFLLTLDTDRIQGEINGTLQRIAANYKKPGFRPGKVPMSVITREYGNEILREAREKNINSGLAKILKENNITLLRPVNIVEKENFAFEITMEQTPSFELQDIKNIHLQRLEAEITDEEVNQFTEKLLRLMGEFESVDRKVKAEDFVEVAYTVRYNGAVVDEIEDVEDRIDLKAPGIDHVDIAEQLVGLKKGDVKVIEKSGKRVKEELQDKLVEITYEIKDVLVCKPHELNSAFLKRVKSASLEEFQEKLRTSLTSTTSRMAYMHMKRQLLDRLSEMYTFDVPNNMVKDETRTIARKINDERDRNPEFTEEITDEEILSLSKRRVQLGILISRMAKEYKIDIKNEQVVYSMFMYASSISQNPNGLMENWVRRPEFVSYFKTELLEIAVIDYLLAGATTEVEKVSVRKLYQEASDFLMDSYELDGIIDDEDYEDEDDSVVQDVIAIESASVEASEAQPVEEVSLEDVKEKKARKPRKKAAEAE